jgi:hypothetical protein
VPFILAGGGHALVSYEQNAAEDYIGAMCDVAQTVLELMVCCRFPIYAIGFFALMNLFAKPESVSFFIQI